MACDIKPDFGYPADLLAVEAYAEASISNAAAIRIYRSLLGGKGWDEVKSQVPAD